MKDEIQKLLAGPGRYWKFPFRYERDGTMIVDSRGARILDVRGWGYLTGSGACALSDEHAVEIQDALGFAVANLLNANWPK